MTASELLKDNDAYLRKLKDITFLGHIEEKDFRRILKFSGIRQYEAGETIQILAHRLCITSEELVQAKEEVVRLRKGAGVRETT